MGDGGRESVQFAQGTGLGLREEALHRQVGGDMANIFKRRSAQQVSYHLQLRGRKRERGMVEVLHFLHLPADHLLSPWLPLQ